MPNRIDLSTHEGAWFLWEKIQEARQLYPHPRDSAKVAPWVCEQTGAHPQSVRRAMLRNTPPKPRGRRRQE